MPVELAGQQRLQLETRKILVDPLGFGGQLRFERSVRLSFLAGQLQQIEKVRRAALQLKYGLHAIAHLRKLLERRLACLRILPKIGVCRLSLERF